MHVCARERERELSFVLCLLPRCCQGPLRNVNVPFCQSRSQSANTHTNTQKVTLSFTQLLIKQTELWSPSCHYSSPCPSLTHLFVSLPRSLSSYLHHSSIFPLFISLYILTPPSSPYLCSSCGFSLYWTKSSLHLSASLVLPPLLPASALYDYQLLVASLALRSHISRDVF